MRSERDGRELFQHGETSRFVGGGGCQNTPKGGLLSSDYTRNAMGFPRFEGRAWENNLRINENPRRAAVTVCRGFRVLVF